MVLGPQIIFVLNVLSAFVAFLTSYFAYRFDRMTNNPLLKAITLGFMLLGVGLLMEAGTSVLLGQTLVEIIVSRYLAVIATFAYLAIQMLAYVVFAVGYGYLAFGRSGQVAAGITILAVAPRVIDLTGLYRFAVASYFVVLVLLAFIVFQGVLTHSKARTRFSLLVLSAFVLLLAAHVLLLVSIVDLSGAIFFLGTAVQFLGFISLLVFLLRSGRVGPA
jgi:hypothetical protein